MRSAGDARGRMALFPDFPALFWKSAELRFLNFKALQDFFLTKSPFLLKPFRVLFLPNVKRPDFAHPFYIVRAQAFSAHAFSRGKSSRSIREDERALFCWKNKETLFFVKKQQKVIKMYDKNIDRRLTSLWKAFIIQKERAQRRSICGRKALYKFCLFPCDLRGAGKGGKWGQSVAPSLRGRLRAATRKNLELEKRKKKWEEN